MILQICASVAGIMQPAYSWYAPAYAARIPRPGPSPKRRRFSIAAVDVLLLDIRLGAASGLALLRLSAERPLPAVVVLTACDYPQYVVAAMRLGAAGFVLKAAPISELVEAIRRAAAGDLAFGVRPSGRAPPSRPESWT